jgi:hypothetical protein
MSNVIQENGGVNDNVEQYIPISVANKVGLEYVAPGFLFKLCLRIVTAQAKKSNKYKARGVWKAEQKKGANPDMKKILWNMGRDPNHYSHIFADGYSYLNHEVKVHAATWRALDIFYNFHEKYAPTLGATLGDIITKFWIAGMKNSQAIVNRKTMSIDLIVQHLHTYKGVEPVKIVSLACGSAQMIIEAVLKYKKPVQVKLLDSDSEALSVAKEAVEAAGLLGQFEFIQVSVDPRKIRRYCYKFKPFLIDMIGLMDYFKDRLATAVISEVKRCLAEDGMFLTCNINYNSEKEALDWVLLWPMIYRTPEEWRDILLQGWFAKDEFEREKVSIIYDPSWIHGIAKCLK